MPDKERRSFEDRVRSGEGAISIINEPIDFVVDFTVKGESAIETARRRWFKSKEEHERE